MSSLTKQRVVRNPALVLFDMDRLQFEFLTRRARGASF